MRADARLNKLARVLVEYSTEVKKGDRVAIYGTVAGAPLLREIYRQVLCAGAHPYLRVQLEDQEYTYYRHAQPHQLDFPDPFELYEVENIDVRINAFPDMNPFALTAIDAESKQRRVRARKAFMEAFFLRWGTGELRWVGTVCPTSALAQEAHMAWEEYADYVFACCKLDDDDPVRSWRDLSAWQQGLCDRLKDYDSMRIVGKDTDLRFRCAGRSWINCDGHNNLPDGEVFTGPIEDSVEGTIRFTFPGVFQGEAVEDIFLRFEQGRVVEARAAEGEALLHGMIGTDEGARYVGEIAVGTNDRIDRFTRNMLLDEKMGGTIHLALGRGIPLCGSRNKSAIHWDLLKDMRDGGEIFADGKLIYQDGRFIQRDT